MAATFFFWVCAVVAFFFGMGVIAARNPMYSALCLVVTFTAMAGLFLLLHAEFLAWILIIVYTGAVMVLIIFVISLLNLQRDDPIQLDTPRRWGIGLVALFGLAFLVYLFRDPSAGFDWTEPPLAGAEWGSPEKIAHDLLTRYLIPFELAAVLLTAAVIGAVVTARQPGAKKNQGPET
ncbi:MAG: NADH-quinone oxidoreductase subunit J [bacterium]